MELSDFDFEVICLGGRVAERPYVLSGDETVENAQKHQAHKMFFPVDAVTPDGFIHSSHHLLYKTMLRNSDEAYFLTGKTKLTGRLDRRLCDFSVFTGVIADFVFPEEIQRAYPHVKYICAKE